MSEWRPRPLRSLRHEAISLLEVAVIPVAIAFVFPYEAVGFHADKRNQESGPSCAFVVLSEAEERVALAAARTSWQVGAKGVQRLRTDISSGELPPAPIRLVMPTRPKRGTSAAPAEYAPNMLPPTVAAPPPAAIAPDAVPDHASKQAFSREELLKID
jgi:hypothetical protein